MGFGSSSSTVSAADEVFSEMLPGTELPCEAIIGRSRVIEHIGGIAISDDARFGDDCVIQDSVIVGCAIAASLVLPASATGST